MTVPVPTLLTGSQSGTNATTYATASVTAAQDDLLLVFTQFIGSTRTVTVSSTTGGALPAFTKHAEVYFNSGLDEQGCHSVVVPVGGFTGTLTITGSGGGQQCHWTVLKIAAGTFNPTTPVPQFRDDDQASGTTYTGASVLSAGASTDSRTFCIAGHCTFEGQGVGASMTEFHDSPGNSAGSPLGRGYSAAWRSDAFETNPSLTGATSSAWGFLAVEVAGPATGSNYNETIDTTVAVTTTVTDLVAATETVATTVTVTTTIVDALTHSEQLDTTVAASTTLTDVLAGAETLATTINVTTTISDSLSGAASNYNEQLDTVVTVTTTIADVRAGVETLATTVAATTTIVDARSMLETLATVVTATTTVVDVRALSELLASIVAVTTGVTDALAGTELIATLINATTSITDVLFVITLDLNPVTATFLEGSTASFRDHGSSSHTESW